MENRGGAGYRLDEIDRRIIYQFMRDARNTSAAQIGDQLNVTGGTIRNRIVNLEEHGILRGYRPTIDFEQADGSIMNVFLCHAKFGNVEGIARKVGTIPGVINARELMGGRMNLHILAVGRDTADLRRIGRELEGAGVEIEDEFLLQTELNFPYTPYGPAEEQRGEPLADYLSLRGGAEVVELTVAENASIVNRNLAEATKEGLLDEDTLVIAIERDDEIITPQGGTSIEANDIVTVFSPDGNTPPSLDAFRDPETTDPGPIEQ